MTEIREFLEFAAGNPEAADLLTRVRRVAARRSRIRRGAVAVGALALAGGIGTGSTLLATPSRRVSPAVLVPLPSASASPSVSDVALCARSQLTVGMPTQVHVRAGEDGVDLPITVAGGGCKLPLGAFGFAPDAAVPVSPMARPPAVFIPRSPVHLVLTGESDGNCATVPHASTVDVTYRGVALASLRLPATGLCGRITAVLQKEQETSCASTDLEAHAEVTPSGAVEVTVRNTADVACSLRRTPARASAVTTAGPVIDLAVHGGAPGSLSLRPGDRAAMTVSGAFSGCSVMPLSPPPTSSRRLTLFIADGATITVALPTSVNFPCLTATVSGFAPLSSSPAPSSQRSIEGPTLTVSPTGGPVGATLTVTGTVSPVSACPRVRISTGADGAGGAATDIVTVAVTGSTAGPGIFSAQVKIPGPRPGESATATPAVVRAYCENAKGSATNTGANPEVDIARTG